LIVLTNKENKRKFSIQQDHLDYLFKLLSLDPKATYHQQLMYTNEIDYIPSLNIGRDIDNILKNNQIWDFDTGIKVVPVLNPPQQSFVDSLKPISKEHKWFLTKLSQFLMNSDGVRVNHE